MFEIGNLGEIDAIRKDCYEDKLLSVKCYDRLEKLFNSYSDLTQYFYASVMIFWSVPVWSIVGPLEVLNFYYKYIWYGVMHNLNSKESAGYWQEYF